MLALLVATVGATAALLAKFCSRGTQFAEQKRHDMAKLLNLCLVILIGITPEGMSPLAIATPTLATGLTTAGMQLTASE